ncbi:FCD domain-containing protein [Microbacterium sp. NPDC055442]
MSDDESAGDAADERAHRLNRRFHSILFAPCPNDQILELVHRGGTRLSGLRGSTFAFVPDRALQSVQEHCDMLEMLRSDVDPVTIELAARNHRWRTKDALLRERSTGPAPLEPV